MKSAIQTNDYISEYFPVTRGIRQGDSLSALLYIIQSEPLAQYIRKSDSIKGIAIKDQQTMTNHVLKTCQYVDDGNLTLNNTNEIDTCLEIIDDFGKASGSTLNRIKTIGVSNKDHKWEYRSITISPGPEIMLGIPIGKNKNVNAFWIKKIEKNFML